MLILSVDDNRIHSYAMRRTLEHSGYRVAEAHTGKDALDIARSELPGVVLLDINLPDISGYEVCSRLKSDVLTSSIPVVFHTATEATSTAKNRAELLGATAFLTYPVQTDHLLTVIKAAAIRNPRKS